MKRVMSVELPLLWKALVQIVHEQEGMVGEAPGIFQPSAELVRFPTSYYPYLATGILLLTMAIATLRILIGEQKVKKMSINILTAVLVVEFTVWSVDTVLWLVVQVAQYLSVPPPRTRTWHYRCMHWPIHSISAGMDGHCGGPGAGHFVKMVHNELRRHHASVCRRV